MTYCFVCDGCDATFETGDPVPAATCPYCKSGPVRRDYRAEGAAINMKEMIVRRDGS